MQPTPYTKRKLYDRLQVVTSRLDLEDSLYDPVTMNDLAVETARQNLMRKENFPFMEESVAYDIDPVANSDPTNRYTVLDVPVDYKEPRELWISNQSGQFMNPLGYLPREKFVRLALSSETSFDSAGELIILNSKFPNGSAGAFSMWGEQFYLFPRITTQGTHRLNLDYYKYLDADISAQPDDFTDGLMALNDTLLYRCLYEVAVMLSDPDAEQRFLGQAEMRFLEDKSVSVNQRQKPLGHRGGDRWGGRG